MHRKRHIYRGVHSAGGLRVTVDDYLLLEPAVSTPASARGASWGERGGALQAIAYAMVAYEIGELAADAVYGAFMTYLQTRLPSPTSGEDWTIASHEIRTWYHHCRHLASRAGIATDPPRRAAKRADLSATVARSPQWLADPLATYRSIGAGMDHAWPNQRARKLIATYALTDADVCHIIAVARLQLATFDPDYRTNVSQLATELDRSRPTLYSWADQALAATVAAFRTVRVGRPLKRLLGHRTERRWSAAERVRHRDVHDGT